MIEGTGTQRGEKPAITKLTHVTILVRDYDEALRFYTEALGFEKRADQTFGPCAHWLTVAPKGQDIQIVLQKPEPALHGEAGAKKMSERIGQGTTWVLGTDDCQKTYEEFSARGVKFTGPPREVPWAVQAVFQDLYGNSFALVQPR